ncbi:type II secretion system protein N [Vibrio sp. SCSIO 43136]|uniref:type II secretion system protein N n=1 Tax=Vibrio sp. SCSIO 43136 TaxID=2819101 RepID=UPI0020764DB1|nr:type II secretion system protein N [Vibrio sp. SCSIO 43136]USD65179.1 type II secretion system protein N [Vibrio sp. SCSIO 43136]
MKRLLAYLAVFLVALVSSLVAYLPASFLLQYAPLPRGLELQGTSGTIWQGQFASVKWQRQQLGEVQWQFQPSALVSGKVEYQVRFGRGSDYKLTGKGLVGLDLTGPYAQNVVASMPAKEVMRYAPRLPVPIDIDGQLEAMVKHLRLGSPWCSEGSGSLVWNASQVGTPLGELAMGPVITDVTCQDNTLSAKGGQNNAQVSSEFSATLSPNMTYQAQGWFKPGAEFPQGLGGQLSWLGAPNNQGQYPMSYSGRL